MHIRHIFKKSNGSYRATLMLLLQIFCILIVNNIFRSTIIMRQVQSCNENFEFDQLENDKNWKEIIANMKKPFGVIILNQHAIQITLNWLCNTANIFNVHERTLFFTLDEFSRINLLKSYPNLKVFRWTISCLTTKFQPTDSTYMSFFILRTKIIRSLISHNVSFWMIQPDTFWRKNLYFLKWKNIAYDILVDQRGSEASPESYKYQMNGANFHIKNPEPMKKFFDNVFWYQLNFYVTDPEIIRFFCRQSTLYRCKFIPYKFISGWEWIYTNQNDPPYFIQLDGETSGGKIQALKDYKLWFLNDDLTCNNKTVNNALKMVLKGQVPKIKTSSKLKQLFYIGIGQLLNEIPIIGKFHEIYGGIVSLYLQVF
ncbi:unnamed protein product [Dracunculus medinensis]|uniref:Nucleotid_trans domain-containing protein n=1 Tax=Dracunculus medinensis TaxID=318479 RepID=A0A0N4UDZ3_DRAME|nr:unnamed protein product [Dracunculus medinensis]